MAPRECEVAVLGGGNAAGYFAKAAAEHGLKGVVIVGEEPVVSYERPALSKAYLFPEGAARLPGFHTCVGGGGERQEAPWYEAKGITFLTGTRVTGADLASKTLTLAGGELKFKKLVIATGTRPVTLADFGAPGASLPGVHALRDVADADALLSDLAAVKAAGGKVVIIGGGYIGAETAAGLSLHGVPVTVVVPEDRLMARVMPAEVAAYYEAFYAAKGITLLKGALATGLTAGPDGRVASVQLKDGTSLPASLVVVGVGARPNAELFQGQLQRESPQGGGVVVDGQLRAHPPGGGAALEDVFAIGDVAAFPLAGVTVRQEHVTHARQSAAHAAAVIAGKAPGPYSYLPFFYSRVFNLSWQFYGSAPADATIVPFGLAPALAAAAEAKPATFGAYWLAGGRVVGVFVESGSPEENAAAKAIAAGAAFLLEAAAARL